jgi:hypothetical protein
MTVLARLLRAIPLAGSKLPMTSCIAFGLTLLCVSSVSAVTTLFEDPLDAFELGTTWQPHGAGVPQLALATDGEVNGLDVDPFVEVLLSGPYQAEADMNEGQVANGLDVDPFVAAVVGSTHQIPEPSTLLLLTLIALGVVGGWRKWKRAA